MTFILKIIHKFCKKVELGYTENRYYFLFWENIGYKIFYSIITKWGLLRLWLLLLCPWYRHRVDSLVFTNVSENHTGSIIRSSTRRYYVSSKTLPPTNRSTPKPLWTSSLSSQPWKSQISHGFLLFSFPLNSLSKYKESNPRLWRVI